MKSTSQQRGGQAGLAGTDGSAASSFHCPKCGKLKRKRDGSPHDCGPTQKQRMEELARDSAALWAVRQTLHDYLEPDGDVPMAAHRVIDEIMSMRRKWESDTYLFSGAWQILKENNLEPDSTTLLAAADRFEKENGLGRQNKTAHARGDDHE